MLFPEECLVVLVEPLIVFRLLVAHYWSCFFYIFVFDIFTKWCIYTMVMAIGTIFPLSDSCLALSLSLSLLNLNMNYILNILS